LPIEDLAEFMSKKGFVADQRIGCKFIMQTLGLKQQEDKVVVTKNMF